MAEATIMLGGAAASDDQPAISAIGRSFDIHEWSGSGPEQLHVHYADDEAWHILEGTLTFKLLDREVEAPAGTTVFIPAGVAHTYYEAHGPTRYLIIMPPNLRNLIAALHAASPEQHPAIMRQFQSEILE